MTDTQEHETRSKTRLLELERALKKEGQENKELILTTEQLQIDKVCRAICIVYINRCDPIYKFMLKVQNHLYKLFFLSECIVVVFV